MLLSSREVLDTYNLPPPRSTLAKYQRQHWHQKPWLQIGSSPASVHLSALTQAYHTLQGLKAEYHE
jgi:hypothetical protein